MAIGIGRKAEEKDNTRALDAMGSGQGRNDSFESMDMCLTKQPVDEGGARFAATLLLTLSSPPLYLSTHLHQQTALRAT